jgi:para-nitrobenzyl esterase
VRSGAVVETTNGRLRGVPDGGVHLFKGVRYAASTAGSNRFLPPHPVETWAEMPDAVS